MPDLSVSLGRQAAPDSHALHDTELEDESVVETVQSGVRSSFYQPGRMVPGWEEGLFIFINCWSTLSNWRNMALHENIYSVK
ncbi:MAG: hypothetical protein IPJ06_19725 [Saprospiraceae bacterium]|nr:hypothetical protein [Saprospiraceae bacterium]